MYNFAQLWFPPVCREHCARPAYAPGDRFDVFVFVTDSARPHAASLQAPVWNASGMALEEGAAGRGRLQLPPPLLRRASRATLYAHAVVVPAGQPVTAAAAAHAPASLVRRMLPLGINRTILVGGEDSDKAAQGIWDEHTPHVRPHVTVRCVADYTPHSLHQRLLLSLLLLLLSLLLYLKKKEEEKGE